VAAGRARNDGAPPKKTGPPSRHHREAGFGQACSHLHSQSVIRVALFEACGTEDRDARSYEVQRAITADAFDEDAPRLCELTSARTGPLEKLTFESDIARRRRPDRRSRAVNRIGALSPGRWDHDRVLLLEAPSVSRRLRSGALTEHDRRETRVSLGGVGNHA